MPTLHNMIDLKNLSDQLRNADLLVVQCPPKTLQFMPSTHLPEPRLGSSPCNTSMIIYLQMLSFLRDEAARPTPDASLLACLQIAQFRLEIERRLDLTHRFLSSAFDGISGS